MSPAKATLKTTDQPQFISPAARRTFFLISLAACLPIAATLGVLNQPLQNEIAPQGVVALELAHTLDRQSEVLASWKGPESLQLAFSLGLDFLCVVVFTSMLVLACIGLAEVARRRNAIGSTLGPYLARGLWIMGLFWTLQNILMTAALFGHATGFGSQVTYWCALFKFSMMGVAYAYIAVVGLAVLIRRQRPA